MGEREGVIKYDLEFQVGPPPRHPELAKLTAWRRLLHRLQLVGQDPARYGGLGFGNVSIRGAGDTFVISATQTGSIKQLSDRHYCLVTQSDLAANRVCAQGPLPPSSEALSHAAAYAGDPAIGCVLHVHSAEIWSRAGELGLPVTSPELAYGTPAMAVRIQELTASAAEADGFCLAMGGHEDGVIATGSSPGRAGCLLVELLARALE